MYDKPETLNSAFQLYLLYISDYIHRGRLCVLHLKIKKEKKKKIPPLLVKIMILIIDKHNRNTHMNNSISKDIIHIIEKQQKK